MPICPHNVSSSTFVYHNDILDTTFFGKKKTWLGIFTNFQGTNFMSHWIVFIGSIL